MADKVKVGSTLKAISWKCSSAMRLGSCVPRPTRPSWNVWPGRGICWDSGCLGALKKTHPLDGS